MGVLLCVMCDNVKEPRKSNYVLHRRLHLSSYDIKRSSKLLFRNHYFSLKIILCPLWIHITRFSRQFNFQALHFTTYNIPLNHIVYPWIFFATYNDISVRFRVTDCAGLSEVTLRSKKTKDMNTVLRDKTCLRISWK